MGDRNLDLVYEIFVGLAILASLQLSFGLFLSLKIYCMYTI